MQQLSNVTKDPGSFFPPSSACSKDTTSLGLHLTMGDACLSTRRVIFPLPHSERKIFPKSHSGEFPFSLFAQNWVARLLLATKEAGKVSLWCFQLLLWEEGVRERLLCGSPTNGGTLPGLKSSLSWYPRECLFSPPLSLSWRTNSRGVTIAVGPSGIKRLWLTKTPWPNLSQAPLSPLHNYASTSACPCWACRAQLQ